MKEKTQLESLLNEYNNIDNEYPQLKLPPNEQIEKIVDWYKWNFNERYNSSDYKEDLLNKEIEDFGRLLYHDKMPVRNHGLKMDGFYIALGTFDNYYRNEVYKIKRELAKKIIKANGGSPKVEVERHGNIRYSDYSDPEITQDEETIRFMKGLNVTTRYQCQLNQIQILEIRSIHDEVNIQGAENYMGVQGKIDQKRLEVKAIGKYFAWLKELRNGNKTKTPQPTPTFEELFVNPEYAKPCLSILRDIAPPFINAENEYIGRNKGIFSLWYKVLSNHDPKIINYYVDKILAAILNGKIKNANLSKDASEFRKTYKRIDNGTYEKQIKEKLSQLSQLGKLGRLEE